MGLLDWFKSSKGSFVIRDTISLNCEKCGAYYIIGENAAVITTAGSFGHFGEDIIVGRGREIDIKDNADLVESYDLSRANSEILRQQSLEIESILQSTGPRWWICKNCRKAQRYPGR